MKTKSNAGAATGGQHAQYNGTKSAGAAAGGQHAQYNSTKQTRAADLQQFEQIIGYEFSDLALLDQALSHSSYTRERKDEELRDNERLEFLGDAFFDAIIGEALYEMFPDAEEGRLSKMRASIVCEASLAQAARRIGLADFLLLGYGEEKNGGRNRDSILADAAEAVVGAIYLDGGYESVKSFVLNTFAKELQDAQEGKFINKDFKSALQEELQAAGIHEIKYILEKEEGPDHDKTFTVRLEVKGQTAGHGTGKSKKNAEQEAAKHALERGIDAF